MSRLLLLSLLIPTAGWAQDGFDAHGFDSAVYDGDVGDLLQTWRPERQKAGAIGLSLLGEYAESPLVLIRGQGADRETLTLLDNLGALNTGIHVGVHERVAVAVGLPLYLTSQGALGADGFGVGDLTVAAPIGILLPDAEEGGLGLSVVPFGILPTGDPERFLGAGTVAGGLTVAPGYDFGAVTVAANAGVELNRTRSYQNIEESPRMVAGLGASWAVTDTFGVGLEADIRGALSKNDVRGAGSPGEAVLHVKGRYPFGLSWVLGGAAGVTRGQSSALFRVFAGLGWTVGKDGPRDYDNDGFIGAADQCEREPETVNSWRDDDGCPDRLANFAIVIKDPEGQPLPAALVRNGDQELGITDSTGRLIVRDLMPGTVLDLTVDHGSGLYVPTQVQTPELIEGDQQGEARVAWRPGTIRVITRNQAGAPVDAKLRFDGPETRDDLLLGADGTELFVLPPGEWSIFATAPGFGTERRDVVLAANENALTVIEFAMAPAVSVVTESGFVILEPVQFDFDSANLRPESRRLLQGVANDIRTTPEIRVVEVQGHTSTEGSTSHNRALSQARVDSVVEFLVSNGVERSRLVGIGYGEGCTAVVERTPEDREQNRRVQFFIVEPEPAGGIPCHMGQPGKLDSQRFEFERQIER